MVGKTSGNEPEKEQHMKALINVDAKTAVLAGLNNSGDYPLEFDPKDLTEEQRAELAQCRVDHQDQFIVNPTNSSLYDIRVSGPTLENLRFILDKRITNKAARKAEKEKQEKENTQKSIKRLEGWIAAPLEEKIRFESYYGVWGYQVKTPYLPITGADLEKIKEKFQSLVPILETEIEDIESACFWLNQNDRIKHSLDEKAKKATKEKEEAEETALESAQKKQIADWVKRKGSNNQRDRLKAGMLPDDEIITEMRNEAFECLGAYRDDRYKKIKASDFCDCDGYDASSDVDYSVHEKETATAEEYEQMKHMQELAPHAEIKLREHIGECGACSKKEKRTGFYVKIPVGAFIFTREYGLC